MNHDTKQQFLLHVRVLLAVLFCHVQMVSAEEMPSEQAVRAAMVFNFLKFAEFPPEATARSGTIRVCVAVRDVRQLEALFALSGSKVGGRELVVADFFDRSGECQVLYVDTRQRWLAAADQPALRYALTISAYPGFASDGGMIEIAMRRDGVRFDINLAESRRAGIHFSPQLLRLARRIHE